MDRSDMRIVLLNTFDIMGGAAKAALRLHQGLNRIGVRHNFLVARKDSNDSDITAVRANNAEEREEWTRLEADVRAEEAPYPNLRLSGYAPFHSERAARSLLLERRLRQLRLHDAEIVNLHWTRGLVDWGTFLASRSSSQAVIWTLHDEHPLTGGCHYSGGCDKASDSCGACPVLESEDSTDLSATVLKRKRIALDAFPGTLSLVAPSHWMARRARASSLFRNHQIDVIPYGIDTGLFKPQPAKRADHGIAPTDMVVLFVAHRLDDPRKGYHHLRDALNALQPRSNLVLVTAGDGEAVPPRHVRTIHLGGLEGESALREAYALADIVVIPSAQDNLPNCCLEAMACGKPVLAYPTGGLPDMVLDGETGVLSAEATPLSLAQALFQCLETPDVLAAMGQRGRERILKDFSLDLQARRYMNLYETAHRKATASGAQRRVPNDAERHSCLLAITQAYGGLPPVTLGVWDFLLRLQADRNICGHALEIGVFQGAAAAALSWHLRPDERYCGIDIHLQTALIRTNVAKLSSEAVDRLDLIESSSAGMARDDLPPAFRGSCRFLHVDGEHSYPAVRRDLDLCLSVMAEDGIIAVDDFANPESVCVAHAVFDHLRDNPHRLRLFLCGGNKAYLCAPAALNAYRQACMESLVPYLERHSKYKIRLAKNSYAWEVDYLSFSDRGDGTPYMEIGKYVQELSP